MKNCINKPDTPQNKIYYEAALRHCNKDIKCIFLSVSKVVLVDLTENMVRHIKQHASYETNTVNLSFT